MKLKHTAIQVFIVILIIGQAGCTQVGQKMGMQGATERAGLVWNNPLPDLEPPSSTRRSIYVQYRDVSGGNLNLRQQIRERVSSAGYTLTSDPNSADYRLMATLRFFGENTKPDDGRAKGSSLGPIAGVATGLGTYAALSAAGVNNTGAILGGAGTGVITGVIANNLTRLVEWNAVIDFALAEKITDGVITEVNSETNINTESKTGIVNGAGQNSGQANSFSGTRQKVEEIRSHQVHAARLTAWTNKWKMTREEAEIVLTQKLLNAIPNALPPAD